MSIPWKALLLVGAAGVLSMTLIPVRASSAAPDAEKKVTVKIVGNLPAQEETSFDMDVDDEAGEEQEVLLDAGECIPMPSGDRCITLALGDPPGKGHQTKRIVIRTDGDDRPRLGVVLRFEKSTKTDARGAFVQAVTPGSPADEAGVKAGDIIVKFDGQSLGGTATKTDEEESAPAARLRELAGKLEEGQKVRLEILRGDKTQDLDVVARKIEGKNIFNWNGDGQDIDIEKYIQGNLPDFDFSCFEDSWMDMELVSLNPDLGEYFGTTEGVLVVKPPENSLGIRAGDVIQKIGDRKVSGPSQAFRILRSYEPGDTVNLDLMRRQKHQALQISVPESSSGRYGHSRTFGKPAPPPPPSAPVRAPAGVRRG